MTAARSSGIALGVAFAASVGWLLLPLETPHGRNPAAELAALCLLFPLAVVALVVHVRRRRPKLLTRALQLFAVALVLRILCVVLAVHAGCRAEPEYRGHLGRDSFKLAGRAQAYGALASTVVAKPFAARAVGELLSEYGAGYGAVYAGYFEANRTYIINWLWTLPSAALSVLFGHSVALLVLPIAVAGAFAVVQAWLLLHRWFRPSTAALAAIYLTFAPEMLIECVWFQKNVFALIVFTYFFELMFDQWRRTESSSRGVLPLLLILALAYTVRHFYVPLLLAAVVYQPLRERIRRPRARLALEIAAVGCFVLAVMRLDDELIRGQGEYLLGCLAGLFVAPGPSLLLAPTQTVPVRVIGLQSALWPWIVGLLAVGMVLVARGRVKLPPVAILSIIGMNALVSAVAGISWLVTGKRLTILPLLLAIAFEGLAVARELPGPQRRRLMATGLLVTSAVLLFHLLVGGLFYLD